MRPANPRASVHPSSAAVTLASMRAHFTILGLGRAVTRVIAMTACLGACKAADPAPDARAPDAASVPALAPDAFMAYGSGGGITGASAHLTVFADGRVERTVSRRPRPLVRVPVARVEQLAADLAATGIFSRPSGSWTPSSPVADGVRSELIVRDKAGAVHSYESATGARAPDTVQRALGVGNAFAGEIEDQDPRVPCACQPGDPLCACR